MKNIHILPTENSSRLSINDGILILHRLQWRKGTQHIYITNDEEIKLGDWVYSIRGFVAKFPNFENSYIKECKKIILTTDQDLIKDGVQDIDDEFLEWFVKNPSCESVEVEYGDDGNGYQIIPKEEPNPFELSKALPDDVFVKSLEELKQETLEELAERLKGKELFKESNDRARETLSEIKSSPKQETMYSEEEVIDLLQKALTHQDDGETGSLVTAQGQIRKANFYSWFNNFKKK